VVTIDEQIRIRSLELGLDEALVRDVIRCEGTMYPTTPNRNIDKLGQVWSRDWGPLQINDFYHEATMRKQGRDIHNNMDSLNYGLEMMQKEGMRPWKASKHCWDKPSKGG